MHLALNKSRLDYKWSILAISFLMEFIALGFCSSNMGLFTVPVTDALGIDRLAYSLSISIRYGIQVIVALFYGSLMNRFGAYDLSGSINELGNVFGENTIDLIKQAVTKLKANDKYVGLSTGDSSEKTLRYWHDMGIDMLSAVSDFDFLRQGMQNNRKTMEGIMKGK